MEHLKPTTRKLIVVAIATVVGLCATLQLVYGGKPMSKIDEPLSQAQPAEEVLDVQTTPVEAVREQEAAVVVPEPVIEETPVVEAPIDPDAALWAAYRYDNTKISCIKQFMAEHPQYFATEQSKKGRLGQIHGMTNGDPCKLYQNTEQQ